MIAYEYTLPNFTFLQKVVLGIHYFASEWVPFVCIPVVVGIRVCVDLVSSEVWISIDVVDEVVKVVVIVLGVIGMVVVVGVIVVVVVCSTKRFAGIMKLT